MASQQREKILAVHFAATKQNELTADFKAFVYCMRQRGKFEQLKQWWEEIEALHILRRANHLIQDSNEQIDERILELPKVEGQTVVFKTQSIGKIYDYQRIVLPQEMQIRIAYDSFIERFLQFLQRKKYAICLSESDLAVRIFVPQTDSETEFDLVLEWDKFIKFAYSRSELYKSFTLFVNHIKIAQTDRPGAGVGYVRFPPATKEMAHYVAAFYFATLENRILYDKTYNDSNKAARDAQTKVEEYEKRLGQAEITLQKRNSDEKKLEEWQTKLAIAKKKFESIKQTNQIELKHSLSKLREQIGQEDFERIRKPSRQFNRTARNQFGPSVKPKSKNGNIESTIIEILNDSLVPPTCPLTPITQVLRFIERTAGDKKGANFCYSCGRRFSKKDQKYEANRFVLGAPSQRPQSGGSEARPYVCGECLTVAFICPVKITSGAIVMQLAPRNETDQPFSIENQLRMLALDELNLVAGRYLLINCLEKIDNKPVSERIGQVQYALWHLTRIFPWETFNAMKIKLFTGGSAIPLEPNHPIWLGLLKEVFSPTLVVKKDGRSAVNVALSKAIRLIEKDEVIAAIYELAMVNSDKKEANPLQENSYRERRILEELREKHYSLLKKGENPQMKKAELFRDVAALTGLTHAYCELTVSRIRTEKIPETEKRKKVQRELKKVIEQVTDPYFFNYAASGLIQSDRARMHCSPDNYFSYKQGENLLKEMLKEEFPNRRIDDNNGEPILQIYSDDIANAYTKLFDERYQTVKDQRKLRYGVKLNLYTKFAYWLRNTEGE